MSFLFAIIALIYGVYRFVTHRKEIMKTACTADKVAYISLTCAAASFVLLIIGTIACSECYVDEWAAWVPFGMMAASILVFVVDALIYELK